MHKQSSQQNFLEQFRMLNPNILYLIYFVRVWFFFFARLFLFQENLIFVRCKGILNSVGEENVYLRITLFLDERAHTDIYSQIFSFFMYVIRVFIIYIHHKYIKINNIYDSGKTGPRGAKRCLQCERSDLKNVILVYLLMQASVINKLWSHKPEARRRLTGNGWTAGHQKQCCQTQPTRSSKQEC